MNILDVVFLPPRELTAEDKIAINRAARAILLDQVREVRDWADRLGMEQVAVKLAEACIIASNYKD